LVGTNKRDKERERREEGQSISPQRKGLWETGKEERKVIKVHSLLPSHS
jgi:hypothetical protein